MRGEVLLTFDGAKVSRPLGEMKQKTLADWIPAFTGMTKSEEKIRTISDTERYQTM